MQTLINYQVNQKLIQEYQSAIPFPHIVLDNFIKNQSIIRTIAEEYRNYDYWGCDNSKYSQNNQIKKYFNPWDSESMNRMPPITKFMIDYLNSREIISFVEQISGIQNLEPDLSLVGAGMHRIDKGGKLSIHIDSNKHAEKQLYRRINLLLYLNENWMHEWGGNLELWNENPFEMVKNISPIFNRSVIFTTQSKSYHGHPKPLMCPENRSRYSIAVYYYSKDYPENEKTNCSSAIWKKTD